MQVVTLTAVMTMTATDVVVTIQNPDYHECRHCRSIKS